MILITEKETLLSIREQKNVSISVRERSISFTYYRTDEKYGMALEIKKILIFKHLRQAIKAYAKIIKALIEKDNWVDLRKYDARWSTQISKVE